MCVKPWSRPVPVFTANTWPKAHPLASDALNKVYTTFLFVHVKYRCLNDPKFGAFLTGSGRVFHILGPE